MVTSQAPRSYRAVYRHAWAWSIMRCSHAGALLFGAGVSAPVAPPAIPILLLLVALILVMLQLFRHYTECVSIARSSISLHKGLSTLRTTTLSIWGLHFRTEQSLAGRLLDYGTIHLYYQGKHYRFEGIGDFYQFRSHLIACQDSITSLDVFFRQHARQDSHKTYRNK